MAINTTNVTSGANFIPEVWADQLSDATQANTVLGNLVDRSYDSQMKMGDTIHITDASNPAVRIKSTDTTGTFSNIAETVQNIQITRQAYVGFLVEDIAEVQSQYPMRESYTSKTTYSLMAFVEGDLTSGLASLPSSFSQAVGTLGVDPTPDNLVRAVQYLDDGDVPDTDRFFYTTPASHAALLKQEVFTSQLYVGQSRAEEANLNGRVGRAYGADVVVSSLANNNPSAAGQGYGWFCHKRGVALIIQRAPSIHSIYVILEIGWGVTVDIIYQFAEREIAPSTLGGGSSDDRFNVAVAGA